MCNIFHRLAFLSGSKCSCLHSLTHIRLRSVYWLYPDCSIIWLVFSSVTVLYGWLLGLLDKICFWLHWILFLLLCTFSFTKLTFILNILELLLFSLLWFHWLKLKCQSIFSLSLSHCVWVCLLAGIGALYVVRVYSSL